MYFQLFVFCRSPGSSSHQEIMMEGRLTLAYSCFETATTALARRQANNRVAINTDALISDLYGGYMGALYVALSIPWAIPPTRIVNNSPGRPCLAVQLVCLAS